MSRRASLARYALVTLNWLSPDRRIERASGTEGTQRRRGRAERGSGPRQGLLLQ